MEFNEYFSPTVGKVYNEYKDMKIHIYIYDEKTGLKSIVSNLFNTYKGICVSNYHVSEITDFIDCFEMPSKILTINGDEFKNWYRGDSPLLDDKRNVYKGKNLYDNQEKFIERFKEILEETTKGIDKIFDLSLPKRVYFNDKKKATTLMMNDDKVIVVKCGKGDKYNRRIGFLEAFYQATCGLSKSKALKYLEEIVKEKEK